MIVELLGSHPWLMVTILVVTIGFLTVTALIRETRQIMLDGVTQSFELFIYFLRDWKTWAVVLPVTAIMLLLKHLGIF